LNIGQPDIPTPQVMIDAYHSFSDKVLAYGPSQGLDIYRQGLVNTTLAMELTLKRMKLSSLLLVRNYNFCY
jgi:aspartate/methionine/tyrosine aminotransferase